MRLGAFDIEARFSSSSDVHKEVGVCLVTRAFTAITLWISHTGADNQVVGLRFLQEVNVALVVGRTVLLIDVVGNREQYAQGIEPSTALEAGSSKLPHAPLHLIFLHQVLSRFGDVEEAVDLLV